MGRALRLAVMGVPVGGGGGELNIVCPAITPSGTAVNPGDADMESDDGTWANEGTPTTNERSSEQAHGGTYSRKIVTDAPNEGIKASSLAAQAGWVAHSFWIYPSSGILLPTTWVYDGGYIALLHSTLTAGAWAQVHQIRRATAAIAMAIRGNAAQTYYVDDAARTNLTPATCLTLLGSKGNANGTYACTPTVTLGTQAGIVIQYADADNFVYVIVNRASGAAELIKRIAGTETVVRTGAITYSAAATLLCSVNGTTYKLYYNGVQVGADATISDAGLGNVVYGFSTFSTNTVGTVTTTSIPL